MATVRLREDEPEGDGTVEEDLPSRLDSRGCKDLLTFSKDKLAVEYREHVESPHENAVGCAQADRPCPSGYMIYYYELTVKHPGECCDVTIGFAKKGFRKKGQHTGWEPGSFGYHSKNGKVYHGSRKGVHYGPRFGYGDVMGAGINFAAQYMFFTKNGADMGPGVRDVRAEDFAGVLYPTFTFGSPKERVEVNFGQRPLLFNVQRLAWDVTPARPVRREPPLSDAMDSDDEPAAEEQAPRARRRRRLPGGARSAETADSG